ncbi:MAG: protein-tyrosine-phosphatase [Bacteroidales bacterium]
MMDWKGFETLQEYATARIAEFKLIPEERRTRLKALAEVIAASESDVVNLIFICTHNSRRSQLAQIWALLGSGLFGLEGVACFSGGTEVSAFNPLAVKAIRSAGFRISTKIPGANPVYLVDYPGANGGVRVFSKKYTDPPNPTRDFHAVMTCPDANKACTVVTGALTRHAITYDDPMIFEGTPQAVEGYAERCRQIAREMLFLFSVTR